MALRSLHSQLVTQVCAHRKRALQIKQNARNDLWCLLRFWVKSRNFVVCKGSKCSYFVRVCACRNSKCMLQFPGSCDFQGFVHARLHILQFAWILCMQELDVLHFPWLCARKGSKCCSKCFTSQGLCARKGSTCFSLLFRKLPDNWAPKKAQNDNWVCKKSPKTTINIGPKSPWTS